MLKGYLGFFPALTKIGKNVYGYGKKKYSLLVQVQTGTATMEISVAVPQEAGNQSTSKSSYTTIEHLHKGLYIPL